MSYVRHNCDYTSLIYEVNRSYASENRYSQQYSQVVLVLGAI